MKFFKAALVCVFSILGISHSARAAVALLSQDWYTGDGSLRIDLPPPANDGVTVSVPTQYTHGPFPQTATNAITFGPGGLNVLVNQRGAWINVLTHPSLLYQTFQNWSVVGFDVQFTIDTPESYTFSGSSAASQGYYIKLVGSNTGTIFNQSQFFLASSGILQPDTYTFSGLSLTNGPNPAWYNSYYSEVINGSLTVTPEPTSLALIALSSSFLIRRRPRRSSTPQRHS